MNAALQKDSDLPALTIASDEDSGVKLPLLVDVSLNDAVRLKECEASVFAEFLGSIRGEKSDEAFAKVVLHSTELWAPLVQVLA